jgi:quercetin dioxygenase-like cupin family protein
VKVISLDAVGKKIPQMEGAAGIFKQVPISKQDGSPTFSLRVFTIDPGGHTPFHQHANEHLNYVIAGSGAIVTESGEERKLVKGDFALVLPHEKHQFRNTSTGEPLLIICGVPIDYE